MNSTRRDFILGGTTLVAGGWTLPGFLWRTAAAQGPSRDDRILVVVQLTGGNDGLNTVIPYADDRYHRARPTLRIAPGDVHRLDDALGLHPEMAGFKSLYDDGALGVIGNVGYPNPDRSHFRSMDIWHCACGAPEQSDDGWLGRVVDRGGGRAEAPLALHLDNGPLPLALRARGAQVPSISRLDAFRLRAEAEAIEAAAAAPREAASDDLLFVQRLTVASCANARRIEQVLDRETGGAGYPDSRLGDRLQQIARLIGADFGARIYYTSLGGFDTHARQVLAHGPLLRELSESVTAFQRDITRRGLADRILLVTFSEFGRRVRENGSQGTDHGAAAPMFLVGSACRPGLTGPPPDLADLDDGDVRHRVDFRQVYATVLEDWLGVAAEPVLGRAYDKLPLL